MNDGGESDDIQERVVLPMLNISFLVRQMLNDEVRLDEEVGRQGLQRIGDLAESVARSFGDAAPTGLASAADPPPEARGTSTESLRAVIQRLHAEIAGIDAQEPESTSFGLNGEPVHGRTLKLMLVK